MSVWSINVDKNGKYTANTENKYVDRNIEINVPSGNIAVDSTQAIALDDKISITYNSSTGNIVASVNTTSEVPMVVSSGWVDDASNKVASISGTANKALSEFITSNGDVSGTFNGLTTTSYSIPDGYTTGGTITLDSTIETTLAAI